MRKSGVINAGVGGNTTGDLLARPDRDCLAHRPELVVLLAGTNDALNSKRLVPPVQFRENLTLLAQRIRAAKSRILHATILPFHPPYLATRHAAEAYGDSPPQERRRLVNAMIRAEAAASGSPLVDLAALFDVLGQVGEEPDSALANVANSGKPDGVHPTVAGLRLIATAVWQAIIAGNLPSGRIVCYGDSITQGCDKASYPLFLESLLAINRGGLS